MKSVEQMEKEKYRKLWGESDYTSRSALPFAEKMLRKVKGDCLEIGCGSGVTMEFLNQAEAIKCVGLDITIAQYKGTGLVYEAPAWRMPFEDQGFNYSFSTDVLEHIPPQMIERTLREITRVTSVRTIHQIACFEMREEHLTVKPMEWWEEQFKKYCEVDFELMEREL